jgi:hypothetical protein
MHHHTWSIFVAILGNFVIEDGPNALLPFFLGVLSSAWLCRVGLVETAVCDQFRAGCELSVNESTEAHTKLGLY